MEEWKRLDPMLRAIVITGLERLLAARRHQNAGAVAEQVAILTALEVAGGQPMVKGGMIGVQHIKVAQAAVEHAFVAALKALHEAAL
jgi:site-specific recombinase